MYAILLTHIVYCQRAYIKIYYYYYYYYYYHLWPSYSHSVKGKDIPLHTCIIFHINIIIPIEYT